MRNISIAALVSALLSALLATPVDSQVIHKESKRRANAASEPAPRLTIAVIAPPPIIIAYPNQAVFVPPGMTLRVNVPVVVAPNGHVFADFGRGFERVVRSCSAAFNLYSSAASAVQPAVSQPVVLQPIPGLPTAQPVPPLSMAYTPPVPNPIATAQQVEAQQEMAQQSSQINRQACWTATYSGQVFIARP